MFVDDAGADATSPVLTRSNWGAVEGCTSPLRFVTDSLANQKIGRGNTEEDLNRLEAARRLLLRVDVVRATSCGCGPRTSQLLSASQELQPLRRRRVRPPGLLRR